MSPSPSTTVFITSSNTGTHPHPSHFPSHTETIQLITNQITMKFQWLQQFHSNRSRSNSFRGELPLNSTADDGAVTKSPASVFWIAFHCLCCLISVVLGFRFSRLVLFLLISNSSTNNLYTTTFTTSFASDIAGTLSFTTLLNRTDAGTVGTSSRVVVGRHGIRIRPWPHPNPEEVMKAHRILESAQREQRVQYGVKNARSLIVVTPTYVRTFQAWHLTGLMHTLMNLPYDVVWIVVEAGGATNETAVLLEKSNSKLRIRHIGFEKTMPDLWNARQKLESEMRLHALRVVREEKLDGIVMFADDSNIHSSELFDEIQKVEWIGAVSVGILAHSSRFNEEPFDSSLPIEGPVCNSSDHLTGWHTFNSTEYQQKSANYIGDMATVLPQKLEWSVFVMNSRLVWEESEFRPEWIKDLDMVLGGDEIENPLAFVEDSSMVEPLGSCGKKAMLWWFREEARADSKFPSGWMIDHPLEVTVPVRRTPWLDVPVEVLSNSEKAITRTQEDALKTRRIKSISRLSTQGERKHEGIYTETSEN